MPAWRQRDDLWTHGPAQPKGVLQFLGGSGLGASPQLSYRRLLEALSSRGWLVQCWSYLPSFDHQLLAVQAWRSFRCQRQSDLPVLRLGHSMGCKLHLLAPDQGRGCSGEALLSFNNFSADRSRLLIAAATTHRTGLAAWDGGTAAASHHHRDRRGLGVSPARQSRPRAGDGATVLLRLRHHLAGRAQPCERRWLRIGVCW